jgi:hypothetical protein
MEDKLLNSFVKKIQSLRIPTYAIGRIQNKDGSTRFFEVIITRPERYYNKDLMKKVPQTYKGFKVKIL